MQWSNKFRQWFSSESSVNPAKPEAETANKEEVQVKVVFIDKDGAKKIVSGKVGTTLLELAHQNNIDLEGIFHCNEPLTLSGACEGSLACST
jgi:GTPase Era involved in 16S rRNA processing